MSDRGLLKEPFLHFAVLGLMLFGVWEFVGEEGEESLSGNAPREVTIKAEEVQMLSLSYAERNGEDPSEEVLAELVTDRVDEEILYLEGLSSGLHLGDPVVRRRVIQKQRFLLEELEAITDPSDEDITARMAADPDRYRTSEAVAFNQHFFDAERRHNAEDDARRALVDLDASDIAPAGDPFVHGHEFGLRSVDSHRDQLGPAFAKALAETAVGEWALAQSRWGWHVVQVTERASGAELTEVSVREQVRFDLLQERRAAAIDAGVASARVRYKITVEGRE